MKAGKPIFAAAMALLVGGAGAGAATRRAQQPGPLPIVTQNVATQPLLAQAARLAEALQAAGSPLSARARAGLERAGREAGEGAALIAVQAALDPECLLMVHINPESRVKVVQGPARADLVEGGWRTFLVKVQNEAGVTAPLRLSSPNALPEFDRENGAGKVWTPDEARARRRDRWMSLTQNTAPPLAKSLSGLALEYCVVRIFSRDAGKREAKLVCSVGQGTQDLGFRSEVSTLFTCTPATEVTLRVRDEKGQPAVAGFVVRDSHGRSYPSQDHRLAPDFFFQPQVYRADGEKLRLPAGRYTVQYGRGPEYRSVQTTIDVTHRPMALTCRLERWIDPSKLGWWSGDHHIHAAGCAHYTNPTQGVHASDMMRHCLGEDLKVGCNLTWGPCFDYQKQFFTGKVDPVSRYPYLLRYDVEVSGFGSHHSGHLCLLRLREQIYPGGDSDKHWPTLCLNTLRWAKKQGALVGPAHSGWGLEVPGDAIPNQTVPPFNGIGANEYIVDVTHVVPGPDGRLVPAVDFLSMVDTPLTWEMNIWYHTLNCGFRTRISGETDFPCIYAERVGLGRSYVKLDGKLDFDSWCEGIRQGRNYVGDGYSHLMDFKAGGVAVGENGSELRLARPGSVRVTVKVAAMLNRQAEPARRPRTWAEKPYWSVERARIGDTREVPIEVIVNGVPVARKALLADGTLQDIAFDVPIERSSWVALRILGSSHTNPIFVVVGGKPIRASRASADWCLEGVDRCWSQKQRFIAPAEMPDALAAYEHARQTYRRIIAECDPQ